MNLAKSKKNNRRYYQLCWYCFSLSVRVCCVRPSKIWKKL